MAVTRLCPSSSLPMAALVYLGVGGEVHGEVAAYSDKYSDAVATEPRSREGCMCSIVRDR